MTEAASAATALSELTCDVVIVGAGLSGLTAAHRLQNEGKSVIVLEARERVGGRTMNEQLPDGSVVEAGGQWVGPTQTAVLTLARDLGIDTFPTHTTGRNIIEYRGRVHRYSGSIPLVASPALAEGYLALKRLERMSKSVSPGAPWNAPKALEWDGQTLQSWIDRKVRSTGGRSLLTLVCEAVWAASPTEVSLLHILAYIASAGGVDALIDTVGGAQESRVVGGSQRLSEALATKLGSDVVQTHSPVHRIEWSDTGVCVHAGNGTVRARAVIVAMSPALTGRISYSPALPAHRDQLCQRSPNGAVTKHMAVYKTPFWRSSGLSGQAILLDSATKIVYDNTPDDSDLGVLLTFFEGDSARAASALTADERRRAVTQTFVRLFGPEASSPVAIVEKDWSDEEYTRGCYGAVLPPRTWTAVGPALRDPVGPIHWASAETATRWMGYMDGAIRSGHETARTVITHLSSGSQRRDGHADA